MTYIKKMRMGSFVFVGLLGLYNGTFGITKEKFDEIFPLLREEVLKNQTKINSGKKKPLSFMYYYLTLYEGYDDKAYSFLELSFPFFESSSSEIETWLKNVDLERVNKMLSECSHAPDDTPLRARVAYSSLLNATTLPEGVEKSTLIGNPEKFKSLVEQKKIDLEKHNSRIAEGLVVRYCCKNNCK